MAVRVLGEDPSDPRLLLVSTDIGWSNRNEAAVDALRTLATVEELGHFSVVTASASPDGADPTRDLGGAVSVFTLRPAAGRSAADFADAVVAHLVPLVGAPSTRAGNVVHVSLLRDEHDEQHLLVVGVDVGDSPRNDERLTAVAQVADVVRLGSFVPHPLARSDEAGRPAGPV
jgi:hypothetical protein